MKNSVISYLREKYPGKWTFNRSAHWWEREDGTHAYRVLMGRDFEGEYTGSWQMCIYFSEKGKTPEWLPFSGLGEYD